MKKRNGIRKLFILLSGIIILVGAGGIYWAYKYIFSPNINPVNGNFIYVRTGSDMNQLLDLLERKEILKNRKSFLWLAEIKGFKDVKPGRYRIRKGMSNNELVNVLNAGIQEPVEFNFKGVRTKEQVVIRIGRRFEADSLELEALINDDDFLGSFGMTRNTVMSMIIPGNYKWKWNTSAREFFDLMAAEYKKVWNEERRSKARDIGLSQSEVVTLASIVEQEQPFHEDEKPVVAGLYMNRLKKGMRLQSDPTVIYAIGDFKIMRVSTEDLRYQSPFNTYLNSGLPPGPICLPSLSSIDAVLNFSSHNYIYMCAKADNSRRHHFTKSWDDHKRYAEDYRSRLDEKNIHRH